MATYDGTPNNDTLIGSDADDKLYGGAGDDTLSGGGGSDALWGGAGDDTLTGGAGEDYFYISSGFGSDIITDFDLSEDLIVADGTLPVHTAWMAEQQGEDAVVDFGNQGHLTFKGVSAEALNAHFRQGDDTLDGTAGDDTIHGFAGNDTLNGLAGNDTLTGGAGDDTLTGGDGNDTLTGGDGDDTFVFDPGFGNDTITDFNPDDDTLDISALDAAGVERPLATQSGDDTVLDFGDQGHLTLKDVKAGLINPLLGGGNDTIVGTLGDDTLHGHAGDDTIDGYAGNDTVYGGAGGDLLQGNLGNDVLHGGPGSDTLQGGDGTDTLDGGTGNDHLHGGAGADRYVFASGFGRDRVYGFNPDEDTLDVSALEAQEGFEMPVAEERGGNTELDFGDDGHVTFMNTAAARVNAYFLRGDDTLDGNAGDDTLNGYAGDDTLNGGAGDDTLYGGAGDDTLTGGEGDDTLTGGAGNDTFVFGPGFGNDTIVDFNPDEDTLDISALDAAGVERPLATQNGDDTVLDFGDQGHLTLEDVNAGRINTLLGGGDDVIVGDPLGKDETFYGHAGDDTINGVGGNNTLYGGAGNDALGGGTGDDTLNAGINGDDKVSGGAGADTFILGFVVGDANQIYGFGNQTITDFNPDEDTLDISALEADPYFEMPLAVQKGDDTVVDFADQGFATGGGSASPNHLTLKDVNAGRINTLLGNGDDTLVGTAGDDTLTGGAGDDTLTGGAGDDTLIGGAGNDTLTGGAGDDTLTGGAGNDTFVFGPGFGNDTITDFNPDEDTLDTSALEALPGFEMPSAVRNGADTVLDFGAQGHLTLKGNVINGNENDNTVDGTTRNDLIYGHGGDDTLNGGAGHDTLYGDVDHESVTPGDDTLNGGAGDDTLYGGAGDDTLTGGEGDDTLTGGAGNDTFVFGPGFGNDTIVDFNPDEDTLDISALDAAGVERPLATQNGDDTVLDFGDQGHLTLEDVNAGRINTLLGGGDDVIVGDPLGKDETFYGHAGDDTINGVGGNNTLYGGAGNDALGGGTGDDTLYGGTGDDTLNAGINGDDKVSGGAGADTFILGFVVGDANQIYGFGNQTITDFNPDEDTLDISALEADPYFEMPLAVQKGDDTVVDFADQGFATGGGSASPNHLTLKDVNAGRINTLLGNGDDTLVGTAGDDTLRGYAGDDTLTGGAGDDTLIGGAGNDTLTGGAGDDTLTGGAGNDTFVFGPGFGNDTITDFNPDEDTLDTSALEALPGFEMPSAVRNGADTVLDFGAQGHLTLKGNVTNGNENDNTVDGTTRNDLIYGHGGDDTLNGGAGHDTLYGDVDHESVTPGDDTLNGGAGDDTLYGGAGDDTLYGGAGDDTLTGGEGDDTLTGGEGDDTFVFGPGFGNDTITDFNPDEDTLDTSALEALAGFEMPSAVRQGADTVLDFGVEGHLTFQNTGVGRVNAYFLRGDDTIDGTAGDDTLNGYAGDDTLNGYAGDDTLTGGDGNDTLTGGDGSDTFIFRSGFGRDVITDFNMDDDALDLGSLEDELYGDDFFQNGADAVLDFGSSIGHLTLKNTDAERVNGLLHSKPLSGSEDDDTLTGGAGRDFVNGKGGDDTIYGGPGRDALWGGEGNDTIYGGQGNDQIDGQAGDDMLYGGQGDDTLIGHAGDDALTGGTGDDTLVGGPGDDTLTGGAGDDSFFYRLTTAFGRDIITDFTDGQDRIELQDPVGIQNYVGKTLVFAMQVGDDVQIDVSHRGTQSADGAGGTIVLEDFDIADLDASDFVF